MNPPFALRQTLAVFLLVAGFALTPTEPLQAGEIKFPTDGSSVALTLPEGWTTSAGNDGSLKCVSGDGEVSFELLPGKVIADQKINLADAAAGLADAAGLKGIKTEDGGEKANVNGVKITGVIVHGTKEDVEYLAVVSILTPKAGEKCAFQCFGTKTAILIHSKDLSRITASFKSAQ